MHQKTKNKGEQYFKEGNVKLISQSPSHLFFKINDHEVYLKIIDGTKQWSCNALTQRRKTGKELWGCTMRTDIDHSKSYCSHTYAAELYLKNKGETND